MSACFASGQCFMTLKIIRTPINSSPKDSLDQTARLTPQSGIQPQCRSASGVGESPRALPPRQITLLIRTPYSICPGRHFSRNTLSIFIASVLHVFDITPGVDASGEPVVLTAEMDGGLLACVSSVMFTSALDLISCTAESLETCRAD